MKDYLKERQRKVSKMNVTRIAWSNGKPSAWRVPCSGGCGGVADHDSHTVRHLVVNHREMLPCDCPAGDKSLVCRHVMGVWSYEHREQGKRVSFWHTETDMLRQKRPHRVIQTARQTVWVTVRRRV